MTIVAQNESAPIPPDATPNGNASFSASVCRDPSLELARLQTLVDSQAAKLNYVCRRLGRAEYTRLTRAPQSHELQIGDAPAFAHTAHVYTCQLCGMEFRFNDGDVEWLHDFSQGCSNPACQRIHEQAFLRELAEAASEADAAYRKGLIPRR